MSDVGVGAAQAYIEGTYGGPTEEVDKVVSVGTNVTNIMGNDPECLALTIVNLGAASLYLMYDNSVSSTRGILLQSGGGFVSMNVRDDQTLPTRAWYGVSASGTIDVLFIRTRRYSYTYQPPAITFDMSKTVPGTQGTTIAQAQQGG